MSTNADNMQSSLFGNASKMWRRFTNSAKERRTTGSGSLSSVNQKRAGTSPIVYRNENPNRKVVECKHHSTDLVEFTGDEVFAS